MGATRDKIVGKVKQVEGKLTGDDVRVAEGTLQVGRGKVIAAADDAGKRVTKAAQNIKTKISKLTSK